MSKKSRFGKPNIVKIHGKLVNLATGETIDTGKGHKPKANKS